MQFRGDLEGGRHFLSNFTLDPPTNIKNTLYKPTAKPINAMTRSSATRFKQNDKRQTEQHISRFPEITEALEIRAGNRASSSIKFTKNETKKAKNLLQYQKNVYLTTFLIAYDKNLEIEKNFSLITQSAFNNVDITYWSTVEQLNDLKTITFKEYTTFCMKNNQDILNGKYQNVELETWSCNTRLEEIKMALNDAYYLFSKFIDSMLKRFDDAKAYVYGRQLVIKICSSFSVLL